MQIQCAILFSGNGSNMQNLIESLHNKHFIHTQTHKDCKLHIALTLCNNTNAHGITRAKNLNIPCAVLPHRDFSSREEFDKQMIATLQTYKIEYVILAGFMRILTPIFTNTFRTINIHPSFLPEHKGANAIKDSFYAKQSYGGVSVHWVNEELDGGEIILQEKIEKIQGESLEGFESRIHALEYTLYPKAILKALHLLPKESSVESYIESHSQPSTESAIESSKDKQ